MSKEKEFEESISLLSGMQIYLESVPDSNSVTVSVGYKNSNLPHECLVKVNSPSYKDGIIKAANKLNLLWTLGEFQKQQDKAFGNG
jgi:hypothetical protein